MSLKPAVQVKRLRVIVMVVIAACLFFCVWALWQFPAYARQLPPRILPNGDWTTAAALDALASLGWTVETYLLWRLGFVLVTAVFYIGLGLFVLVRCGDDTFALLFALSLVLFGVGTSDLPFVLEQWGAWGDRLAYGLATVSFGLLMFLVFLFPDGRFVPRQMRWVGVAAGLFTIYAGFFQPHPTRPPAPYLSIISSLLFLVGVHSQVYRYRVVGTAVQRQQTKWVLWAIVLNLVYKLLLTIIYVNPAVNALTGQGMWYSLLRTATLTVVAACVPIAITLAILRYKLWNIDVIIRKTLVYGIMIASVIGLYALVVGYLGYLFQTEEANFLLSLAATGLVAVLFTPFKNYIEQQINRLFYGQRDEPYQLLTRLGQQLEAALDPAAALTVTVETVARALKLHYAAIALQADGRFQTAAEFGSYQNQPSTFPLVYAGETIGELIVTARSPRESLTPADIRLLTNLAGHISPTAHATRLARELEQARLRIVTAREETRRQLGSDLHDGIGHQLAGLIRQVEQADRLLANEPAALSAHLAAINRHLNQTITEVRQLAHQLHPPELEFLGLVGALRERVEATQSFAVRLNVPETLPSLPAAVETAVYYITLEALTNIEKHARAGTAVISLRLVEDATLLTTCTLHLEIKDDGQGMAVQDRRGLGHLSMQARAAEVGGVCTIQPSAEGGMRVTVCLPLPHQTG